MPLHSGLIASRAASYNAGPRFTLKEISMGFDAYANDDDVLNVQGDALTVTNGTTRVTLAGTLELTRDKRGLAAALALKAALDSVVAALQTDPHLPAQVKDEPDAKPGVVDNPFR
ncbi:hypothetical protein PT2222_100144 [Paraburkholderia tropica]